jgi:ankyrin repeat protein
MVCPLLKLKNAFKAVRAGDLRTLELIAQVRPEGLFEKDGNGWAPVHEAVRYGNLDVLKFLIEHGVSANEKTGFPGENRAQRFIPIELALELLDEDHEVTKYLWTVTKL